MANGDGVLAAVGPAGGGAVLVLCVNTSTGEPVATVLLGPFRGRDMPLLAEHAGRYPRAILAEDEAARATFLAQAQVSRDRLPDALHHDAGGAVPRHDLGTNHRLPGALFLDMGAAVPGHGLPARNVLHEPLLFSAGAQVPRFGLMPGDRLRRALVLDAAAAVPRGGPIPNDGALLLLSGAAEPERGLILDNGLRVVLQDAGAGPPRGYHFADNQLYAALLARDGLRVVVTNEPGGHHGSFVVLVDGGRGRGLLPSSTLFRDGLVTEPGNSPTAAFLPTPEADERVVVRVFTTDNDRIHGPLIAATEDQGLGRPLLAALVASIRAHGEQSALEVVFEVEDLRCGLLSPATARGRHDELLVGLTGSEGRVAVRVFVAANDGSCGRGPFIAATADQCFGRSLLAALVVSIRGRRDPSYLQVLFKVEVLRRGLSAAATGEHRFEHGLGRGLLASPRNSRGHGDGQASSSSTAKPAAASAPRCSSGPYRPVRRATGGIKVRRLVRYRRANHIIKVENLSIQNLVESRNVDNICSQKLMRFRSLLGDFVWFAVPSVLLFYPRKVEGNQEAKDHQEKSKPLLTWLEMIKDSEDPSTEKRVIMTLFVIFLSIWIMAYLLASLGRGNGCVRVVGTLTHLTVISIVAFIDYMLSKSMPQNMLYEVLFSVHFIMMTICISHIWRRFAKETTWQPSSSESFRTRAWPWRRSQHQESNRPGENGLTEPLLAPDIV